MWCFWQLANFLDWIEYLSKSISSLCILIRGFTGLQAKREETTNIFLQKNLSHQQFFSIKLHDNLFPYSLTTIHFFQTAFFLGHIQASEDSFLSFCLFSIWKKEKSLHNGADLSIPITILALQFDGVWPDSCREKKKKKEEKQCCGYLPGFSCHCWIHQRSFL